MLNIVGRICWFRSVNNTGPIESKQTVPYSWCGLPTTVLSIQISVKELLEVVDSPLLVQIVPFLRVMDTKPMRTGQQRRPQRLRKGIRLHHLSFDAENRKPLMVPSVCSIVE